MCTSRHYTAHLNLSYMLSVNSYLSKTEEGKVLSPVPGTGGAFPAHVVLHVDI